MDFEQINLEEAIVKAEAYRDMLREDGKLPTRKGNKVSIDVKFYSTYEDVTVRGGSYDEEGVFWLDWCNHAGATEEDSYDGYYDQYREQLVEYESKWLVCDKCEEAIKEVFDEDSEDYDE